MIIDEKKSDGMAAKAVNETRPREYRSRPDTLSITGPILKFELANAAEKPATAETCYRKKQACYAKFRAAAASVPLEQTADGHLHLVTAIDCDSHEIVGSVSLYRRGDGAMLPLERALGGMVRLQPEIDSWRGRHVVEFSGLWADEIWRKTGLSEQLMLVAFAAAHRLRADKIVGFSHQHVLEFYGTVGLVPDFGLGQYDYPNADYVSTVVWGDPVAFLTLPVERRPMVKRFADCISFGQPILWRNFNERLALKP
ncbi:hypothetical protein M2650_15930 [Luteimonas sp. SX5]|uniref:GNAT family N-acetyltransferase n=1 Tax=Luteimonas galliterrae TaxID=2940486 RepID=A0ABT0MMM4_9GAMM|nr:hypothetical protein [Luteimonas galliterrae]MCL1636112.1 hypothetical protein [Luteimonas galliterrae]